MKTLPPEFIIQDETKTRQPVELYNLWTDSGDYYRYTSADKEVIYNNQKYTPKTIKRSSIKYNESLSTMQVTLSVIHSDDPANQFILTTPIELIWVQIIKVFRDQVPYYASSLFTGTIKTGDFKGNVSSLVCTGFEHFLKRIIPKERHQPTCNVFLYSEKCKVDKTLFSITTTIAQITNGLILRVSGSINETEGYYIWGYVETGEYYSMIVDQSGGTLYLRYPIVAEVGDVITVYAGCNGKVSTCEDKFNNIDNFRGQPMISIDNPLIWVGR